ncbi:MAG: hypothetical protein JWL61_103 [Gemmatimonadetes bacterium]|nr:hypothetical protein [Gemmatimonadota bacterium]
MPFFWRFVPRRLRFRIMTWSVQRHMVRQQKRLVRALRGDVTLLTWSNRRSVVALLKRRWDETGVRMVGVPDDAYAAYADQLLMVLSQRLPDVVADALMAERLATFEAELGLRDSPEPHRLRLAAALRTTIASQVA